MANQDTLPPTHAPDPTMNYERSDPKRESPDGRLGQPPQTPAARPDRMEDVARGASRPSAINTSPETARPIVDPDKIEGDMTTEEPLGWDQAPIDESDPKSQRHPRPDGVGGIVRREDRGVKTEK